jgi:hypothetical protein
MLPGKSPPSSNRSHPLPSGGCCEENLHRLANGGYRRAVDAARKISTVWRTVATGCGGYGLRWLRVAVVTGERGTVGFLALT